MVADKFDNHKTHHECIWTIKDHNAHKGQPSLVDVHYQCYCGNLSFGIRTIDEFVEELKQGNNED